MIRPGGAPHVGIADPGERCTNSDDLGGRPGGQHGGVEFDLGPGQCSELLAGQRLVHRPDLGGLEDSFTLLGLQVCAGLLGGRHCLLGLRLRVLRHLLRFQRFVVGDLERLHVGNGLTRDHLESGHLVEQGLRRVTDEDGVETIDPRAPVTGVDQCINCALQAFGLLLLLGKGALGCQGGLVRRRDSAALVVQFDRGVVNGLGGLLGLAAQLRVFGEHVIRALRSRFGTSRRTCAQCNRQRQHHSRYHGVHDGGITLPHHDDETPQHFTRANPSPLPLCVPNRSAAHSVRLVSTDPAALTNPARLHRPSPHRARTARLSATGCSEAIGRVPLECGPAQWSCSVV